MTHLIERLPVLVLHPHSRCNCRCLMCDIWKDPGTREITAGQLASHLAGLRSLHVQWVVFSGGEPLMHADLFRLASLLSDEGMRTTLLTTGLLLARNARWVAETISDVIVSLDGPPGLHDGIRRVPGAFEQLAEGVRALRRLRPNYPVAARATVQRANFRALRATVAAARELALDSISFLAADVTSSAFNRPDGWPPERQMTVALGEHDIDALGAEIAALVAEEAGRGFVLEPPEKLARIANHFKAHLGLAPAVAPRCNAPWVSAVIESDGQVRPCFFHPGFGNWGSTSLAEILNGPQALAFRQSLHVAENPVCKRCVCALHRADGPQALT